MQKVKNRCEWECVYIVSVASAFLRVRAKIIAHLLARERVCVCVYVRVLPLPLYELICALQIDALFLVYIYIYL